MWLLVLLLREALLESYQETSQGITAGPMKRKKSNEKLTLAAVTAVEKLYNLKLSHRIQYNQILK